MKDKYGRAILLFSIVIGELILYFLLYKYVTAKFVVIETILHIIGIIEIINIIRVSDRLSFDIKWIFIITLFPAFGILVYLFLFSGLYINKTCKSIIKEEKIASSYYKQDDGVILELCEKYPYHKGYFNYFSVNGFPIYRNYYYDYYSPGEKGFKVMLEEMKKAKKYIFMEYFIIEEGVMFNAMLDILKQKAKEGVKCRVMYDDYGSIDTVPASYAEKLESMGIEAVSFNKVSPIVNVIMNNRDHRKILVIDGEVAFTGGINLADEYINKKVRYGHWLDNALRIKGPAINSMIITFLTNWNAIRHDDNDYSVYFANKKYKKEPDGYIIPYSSSPLKHELVARNIYLDILNSANNYVYIMMPYLVLDEETLNCLIHTARKGVDVTIILPGIYDKKMVYMIGKSYYKQLLEAGIKIYEYQPGFVHSKVFIADDKVCTVGSINIDYRSLYLSFENGVYLYGSNKISEVKEDFDYALSKSKQVDMEYATFGVVENVIISVIRLLSSLL